MRAFPLASCPQILGCVTGAPLLKKAAVIVLPDARNRLAGADL